MRQWPVQFTVDQVALEQFAREVRQVVEDRLPDVGEHEKCTIQPLELGNCEIHIRGHSIRVYDGEHWREVSSVSDAVAIIVGERARERHTGMKAHILETADKDVR